MRKIIIFVVLLMYSSLAYSPEKDPMWDVEVVNKYLQRLEYNKTYSKVVDMIKQFEGLVLVPYIDVKQFSIGYGHYIRPGEKFKRITKEEAELLLYLDLEECIYTVEKYTNLNRYESPNKVLSLASFVYNVGKGNFINSTLLTKLNNEQCINEEFLRWVKIKKNNGYIISTHLTERRKIELLLFHS